MAEPTNTDDTYAISWFHVVGVEHIEDRSSSTLIATLNERNWRNDEALFLKNET